MPASKSFDSVCSNRERIIGRRGQRLSKPFHDVIGFTDARVRVFPGGCVRAGASRGKRGKCSTETRHRENEERLNWMQEKECHQISPGSIGLPPLCSVFLAFRLPRIDHRGAYVHTHSPASVRTRRYVHGKARYPASRKDRCNRSNYLERSSPVIFAHSVRGSVTLSLDNGHARLRQYRTTIYTLPCAHTPVILRPRTVANATIRVCYVAFRADAFLIPF